MKPATKRTLAASAVALVAVAAAVGVARTPLPTTPTACGPDPAASIAAIPAGGTWTGSGCYNTAGIKITKPITIAPPVGSPPGTRIKFEDLATTKPAKGALQPIILIRDVAPLPGQPHSVTISDVDVQGMNVAGKFGGALVGQAGFKLANTQDVLLSDDSASATYGDCLEVWAFPPKDGAPNTGLDVNTFRGADCGRDGLSPSDVTDSSFTGVTIGKAVRGVDFESDIKGVGAGNLTFTDCSWAGWTVGEAITGPITVDKSSFTGQILVRHSIFWPSAITFSNGSFAAVAKASVAGISLSRGVLVFDNEKLTRLPTKGAPKAPAYKVINGGQLTFDNSPITPPAGTKDAMSSVVVSP